MFLTREEVETLTGRKVKALQCAQLRKMGIAFHINASGWPVVTRSAVEGKGAAIKDSTRAIPAALRNAA